MTANKGKICNRGADLLENGFIIKKAPSLKGLDAMVEVAQRLTFLVPSISGTLGTDAVTKNSAWKGSPPITRDL